MNDTTLLYPDRQAIEAAHQRLKGKVLCTPVMRNDQIDAATGCNIWFKCEHLQETGSFKFRGACNAVALLPDDCPGVATHSSGNHGAALARAAQLRGFSADIVMPENAVQAKMDAVRRFGGRVHLCAPSQAAREQSLQTLADAGLAVIPPFDDARVIAGQASCALELMEQCPDLDCIISSVGGGGLLAGTLLAAALGHPSMTNQATANLMAVPVFGAEPEGADDTARAVRDGKPPATHDPQTMADGLRMQVGKLNLAVIYGRTAGIITVTEQQIVEAMVLLWSNLKQVIEPSGAVALAAVLAQPEQFRGKTVAVILSGGNLDIEARLRAWLA